MKICVNSKNLRRLLFHSHLNKWIRGTKPVIRGSDGVPQVKWTSQNHFWCISEHLKSTQTEKSHKTRRGRKRSCWNNVQKKLNLVELRVKQLKNNCNKWYDKLTQQWNITFKADLLNLSEKHSAVTESNVSLVLVSTHSWGGSIRLFSCRTCDRSDPQCISPSACCFTHWEMRRGYSYKELVSGPLS